MATTSLNLFGQHPNELCPQKHSWFGMDGWYSVPRGWYARSISGTAETEVSPNANFSNPKYRARLAPDGVLVFQDLMRTL